MGHADLIVRDSCQPCAALDAIYARRRSTISLLESFVIQKKFFFAELSRKLEQRGSVVEVKISHH